MQIGWSTLAFASGAVASTVVAMSVMSLNSQPVRDNAFHVCVANDRVLRLVETDEPCPEGQQRLRLQEADTPDVEPPKETDNQKTGTKKEQAANPAEPKKPETPPSEPAEFKKMPPAANKVRAPFEVVDASGRTILRVDSNLRGGHRGLGIYDAALQATPVAYVVTEPGGNGLLRAESPSGRFSAAIAAREDVAGLRVRTKDQAMPAATLEVTGSGKGTVTVGDGTTQVAAMVARADSKGQIEVNSGTTNVITLTEGTIGGMLQIADKGGRTMVEAGIDPKDGVGVVRAGPRSGPGRMIGPAILVSRVVGER
jgi:hypothetical protein